MGFTGFYWVLLGFTGFYWVLLGFTGIETDLTGFYSFFLPGFTGFSLGFTGMSICFDAGLTEERNPTKNSFKKNRNSCFFLFLGFWFLVSLSIKERDFGVGHFFK